ncbi:hypothetical protein GB882_02955, partial [Georgenia ruanii]|nr:hypothetical protein [Georgenia ruanii]
VLTVALLTLVAPVPAAHAATSATRLAGADRYATSATISAATFPRGVDVAYVASGLDYPDALAGAAVAGRQGAPVLLVSPTAVPATVRTELDRLRPGRIVVLGGPGAVGDAILQALKAHTTGQVSRISGDDRYATSARLSASAFGAGVPVAYVASGRDYPDALSGAAAAGSRGAPLLLVPGDRITAEVRAELERLRPGRVVVLGGVGAVSDAVKAELARYGSVSRTAGADRYATSAQVSASTFAAGVPVAYLASGRDFPDALAGAPVAGMSGAPVLLVTPDGVPAAVRTELTRLAPQRVVVLGGPGAVSDAVLAQATGSGEIAKIAATYTPPPASKGAGAAALAWAGTQLGVPYLYGGTGPEGGHTGYDCSGLIMRAYQHAGATVPRTTKQQWAATRRVALADLTPGDIVFWSSDGEPTGIYHDALYAGVDPVTGKHMRLQSPSPGKTVELVPMLETNLLPFGGRIG